jgi:hypothetical protein
VSQGEVVFFVLAAGGDWNDVIDVEAVSLQVKVDTLFTEVADLVLTIPQAAFKLRALFNCQPCER